MEQTIRLFMFMIKVQHLIHHTETVMSSQGITCDINDIDDTGSSAFPVARGSVTLNKYAIVFCNRLAHLWKCTVNFPLKNEIGFCESKILFCF
ncbi:MAG: hypothetical protein J6Y01_08385 [Spirochaetales bacterium]|nr:hypothetical protein [Spirochaetales bacterium]